ncbi:zinc-binding alcohol dehydrogenase family protein [Streptomyces sp. NPDC087300]|uniref:quinone oxidoreductase family protein n=1 Tax=Streptomyces sp. NPDC087300 TaxID=3365780 RepID=UPI00382555D1
MVTVKAAVVSSFGGPEVLALVDVSDPVAGAGEAVVTVEASGVGYVDVMARRGEYSPLSVPGFTPGVEIAGVVTEVGEGVDSGWIGRRVFAQVQGGGYAQKTLVEADSLAAVPEGISASEAVAIGVNGLVARIGLARAGVGSGDSVVVRGARGGIGLMAVQQAAALGAEVTAVVSRRRPDDRLEEFGASRVVPCAEAGASGEYDVVVDTVGGDEVGAWVARLRPNGRFVLCGAAGGVPDTNFGEVLLENYHKSPTFIAFSLGSLPGPAIVQQAQVLLEAAAAGRLRGVVQEVLPLAQAHQAHELVEGGGLFGKVVLSP